MAIFERVHGLRSRSVEGALQSGFAFAQKDSGWTSLSTVLKDKAVDAASRLGSCRLRFEKVPGYPNSPVTLMRKWLSKKDDNELLFGSRRSAPDLDDAVKIILAYLNISAPEGCVYSLNSCRIEAHAESLLFPQVSFDVCYRNSTGSQKTCLRSTLITEWFSHGKYSFSLRNPQSLKI